MTFREPEWFGLGLRELPLRVHIVLRAALSPLRDLVLRRGSVRFRKVGLDDPEVRKARGNAADAPDGGDVLMHRNPSIAPLLDLRRRLKAVMGCSGFSRWKSVQ